MSKIPDSELSRKTEHIKLEIKRIQVMIANNEDKLRAADECFKEVQDKIREINNANKEAQKEMDRIKSIKNNKTEELEKQLQINLAKINTEHQRVLERKMQLHEREQNGTYDVQQLEHNLKESLKRKLRELEQKKRELHQAEINLMHMQHGQEECIKYILSNKTYFNQNYDEEEQYYEEDPFEYGSDDSFDELNIRMYELQRKQIDCIHKIDALKKKQKILLDMKNDFLKSIAEEKEKQKT